MLIFASFNLENKTSRNVTCFTSVNHCVKCDPPDVLVATSSVGCTVPCNSEVAVTGNLLNGIRVKPWTVTWTAFLMRKLNF